MRHLSFLTAAALLSLASPAGLLAQSTGLSITNYQLVNEIRVTRTVSDFEYRADVVNTGAARISVTATVSTSAQGLEVRQPNLHFSNVPANGRATSTDTFVIRFDRTLTFNVSSLNWTFSSVSAPVANAGANQTRLVGQTATLNGSASTNPSGAGTLTYAWQFVSRPAGSNATLQNANTVNPTFVVDVAGAYVVRLTVSNGFGTDSAQTQVSTSNSPPVANAGANQSVPVGATVQLNGSGSIDVDGNPLTYAWALTTRPTNSSATLSSATAVNPSFVADRAGTYVATLVVNDGTVNSPASTVTISTTNTIPVANAGSNQNVNVGASVQLNGAASTDVDGDPLTYKWTLQSRPSTSTAALSSTTIVNPTFTADKQGTYVAQLIVNDGKVDSAAVTVTISTNAVLAPTANAGANQTVRHGALVQLNGSASSDPAGRPLTFVWSFTTRPTGSTATLSSTTLVNPTFTADKPGDYVLQLIANNGFVDSAPSTVTITTTNTAPVANAGNAQTVTVNNLVTLSGAASSDADGDPLTYAWTFSSRPVNSNAALQGANSVSPTFTPDIAGAYVVQLIVSDAFTSSTPSTVTITANAGAAASITVNGGAPQSAAINTAFATVLSALVRDSNGNPVPSVVVTFLAPSSGASGVFTGTNNISTTATTNSSGIATAAVFTANGTAGGYNVVATAPGVASGANFALTNTAGSASQISVSAGAGQSAAINTAFTNPLIALVRDAGNNPLAGVTVTFTAPGSGPSGVFSNSTATITATTNASGLASATFTANASAGAYNVVATVTGVATGASFGLTNNAGAASQVTVSAGSGQSAQINTAFANPLVALVRDAGNNPVSGVTVTFTAPASGASGAFGGNATTTAVTNSQGLATSAAFTANGTAGGPYNVVATIPSVATGANFALTNTAGAPSQISVSSGSGQSAAINTAFTNPLVALVRDGGNNPVAGVTVTFTAPASGAGGAFGGNATTTATTNAQGLATASAFTANGTAGGYNVVATVSGGATGANFALTNTAGAASQVTVSAGSGQSAAINTAFTNPLVALVRDAGNNPVQGVTVTFTAPASGASGAFGGNATTTAVSNAQGLATASAFTANATAGGPYNVVATIPSVATGANFALTNTAGAASQVTVSAGSGQSAAINTAFTNPLVALVRDAGNNPVQGVTVTFTAPASGASGAFGGNATTTAVSNAQGLATASAFTANATAGGPYNVVATIPSVATGANFALTNTAGAASQVTVSAGSGQSAAINTAFTNPLVALVRDAGNNPVQGVTVTFTAPASGASGAFGGNATTTAVSNAQGLATASAFTANATAGGPYNVVATIPSVATGANFALTNTAGAASQVTVSAGSGQSAAINTAFTNPLVALVRDAGNNPVQGVTVTFTAPASGASGAFGGNATTTAVSNAQGLATASAFTANATAGGPYNVVATIPSVATGANFALTNTAGAASQVTVSAGSGQSAAINTAFTNPLVALVRDAGNNPVQGVTVTFTAPASGASGAFGGNATTTAVSNAQGLATASAFTANATAGGPYNVVATIPSVATGANFALTNTAGAAAAISATAGTPQSVAIGAAYVAFQATVVDAGGNPVSGAAVTFTAPGSGATGTFAGGGATVTVNTGANGVATSTVLTANNTLGAFSVTATVPGVATGATFALTNTAGAAASIQLTAGNNQTATVGAAYATALRVTVVDAQSNPVPNVQVTLTAPNSGASGTFQGGALTFVANTNAQGQVTATTFTANATVGAFTVSAAVSGVTPVNFSLTNTASTPASISVSAGAGQSAPINTAFATALRALVRDAGNNPVAGATVTFTAPGSGPSGLFATTPAAVVATAVTDASGLATAPAFTANLATGSYNVVATVTGVASGANFGLTNTVGAPSQVSVSSGSGQFATVSLGFNNRLVALVRDAGNNPIQNVTVTFTAPGSGPSVAFAGGVNTAVTDASGLATSAALTANNSAGAYAVNATISGVALPASFLLTNTPGPAATISVVSGSSQSATVNTFFNNVLVALVRDSFGNAVANATVNFQAPLSGASVVFSGVGPSASVQTNSSGLAASPSFNANASTGTYNVTASTGAITPASFSLTNTAVPSGNVILVPTAVVGRNLQVPVIVTLSPAPSVGVTLNVTSANGSNVRVSARSGTAGTTSATVDVLPGSNQAIFYVQGQNPAGTPAATNVTVSTANYTSGQGAMTLAPSGFILWQADVPTRGFTVPAGDNTKVLTVQPARLDASGNFVEVQALSGAIASVAVPIAGAPSTVGAPLNSTVSITAGQDNGTTTFRALNPGNASVTITTPTGYTTVSGGMNALAATVTGPSLTAANATIGRNLQVNMAIGMNAPAPTQRLVTIASNDPTKLLFSTTPNGTGQASITMTVEPGRSGTFDFYAQALTNTGSTTFTATAPGYASVSGTVTFGNSGFVAVTPAGLGGDFTVNSNSFNQGIDIYPALLDGANNYVAQQLLRGGLTATVNVVSSNTGAGVIMFAPVTINGGDAAGYAEFDPVGGGTTTVTVSTTTPGFSTPAVGSGGSFVVTVNPPGIGGMPFELVIGNKLQTLVPFTLGQAAPVGGVNVTFTLVGSGAALSNTGTSAGSSSITVNVAGGTSSGQFFLQGLANTGTLSMNVSAPGYQSRTITIFTVPSGFVIEGPFGLGAVFHPAPLSQGPQLLNVHVMPLDSVSFAPLVDQFGQSLAPGQSATVNVARTGGGTGAGTFPATYSFTSGMTTVAGTFRSTAIGAMTVSISTPAPTGFSTVTDYQSVTFSILN